MVDRWYGDNSIKSIRMSLLTTIFADVFANMYALKSIDLSIPLQFPNRCFSNCTSLNTLIMRNTDAITTMVDTSITIPDSVTSIGDNAFAECPNLTIYCYENSTAHQYATNNNINIEFITE